MNLGIMLLKSMKYRDNYEKFKPIIRSESIVTAYTKRTLELFGEFFKESEYKKIDFDVFWTWCEVSHKLNDKGYELILVEHLKDAEEDLPADIDKVLHDRVAKEVCALQVDSIVRAHRAGKTIDLIGEIQGQLHELEQVLNREQNRMKPCDIPIEELLAVDENNLGLKWRLGSLNNSMRPCRGGDFIIIAARPDSGKTSFIADQLAYFSQQLEIGEKIMWLNNEGPGSKIKQRVYQAALNASNPELQKMLNENTLHSKFAQTNAQAIEVYDIHDFYSYDIEKLIKEQRPTVVVFDMIDNVKFAGQNHLGGTRTDQILESMYQWARGLAVKYDCVMIATSQISQDGEGMKFPNQTMLKDSKTGKQGACDVILMIGCEDKNSDRRYLSTPKNKLTIPTGRTSPNVEVYFDLHRSRYNAEPEKFEVENDDGSMGW